MRGKFITIEGCEGVGKSTQTALLVDYLQRQGKKVYYTREPGGTTISESIRKIILDPTNKEMDDFTELLLYVAARRQLTSEIIRTKLNDGFFVICDRYIDSTLAYQGYARGLDKNIIKYLNSLAMGDVVIDATIFLDLDPIDSFKRKGGADVTDRLEMETIEFHKKVYDGYCRIAQEYPDRIAVIDASADEKKVFDCITAVLRQKGLI